VFWTPPELTAPNEHDEVNSSLCHGFIFDICAVEVDRTTGELRFDRYVTMHDCGRILHPGMVAGQVTGGFAQAFGAATLEEHSYGADGSFLAGTLADYLIPTAMEVPEPIILHHETLSPFTPLGSKGVGEGNCMSTPVCIANAVADALGLADITLPILPSRLTEHLHPPEREPGRTRQRAPKQGERTLFGEGSTTVNAPRDQIWEMLLDPATLAAIIPGAHSIEKTSDTAFRAEVTLGIGPVKGTYRAAIDLSDLEPPEAVTLTGSANGALGFGAGTGRVTLREETPGRTILSYRYEVAIGGKVASIGGRLLDGAARVIIGQFFSALAARAGGQRAGGASLRSTATWFVPFLSQPGGIFPSLSKSGRTLPFLSRLSRIFPFLSKPSRIFSLLSKPSRVFPFVSWPGLARPPTTSPHQAPQTETDRPAPAMTQEKSSPTGPRATLLTRLLRWLRGTP
jgi:2-furoyl-CoA dehydrogenase large subunit